MTVRPVGEEEGEDAGPRRARRRSGRSGRRGRRPSRSAAAAVASFGAHGPQLGHPLGRLVVADPRVVEPGGDEQRRVVGGRPCCRRASSRACSSAHGSSRGSPHSSHSVTVSGSVGSLIVVTTSTNGTSATTARNSSGRMRHARADEQAAGAAAADGDSVGSRPAVGRRRCSTQAMVSVNVLRLCEQLAVEVPAPAEFAAAAGVDERPHRTPVEQGEPGDAEPRWHRRLVAAVAVHAGTGAVPSAAVSTCGARCRPAPGCRRVRWPTRALGYVARQVDVRHRASA